MIKTCLPFGSLTDMLITLFYLRSCFGVSTDQLGKSQIFV